MMESLPALVSMVLLTSSHLSPVKPGRHWQWPLIQVPPFWQVPGRKGDGNGMGRDTEMGQGGSGVRITWGGG